MAKYTAEQILAAAEKRQAAGKFKNPEERARWEQEKFAKYQVPLPKERTIPTPVGVNISHKELEQIQNPIGALWDSFMDMGEKMDRVQRGTGRVIEGVADVARGKGVEPAWEDLKAIAHGGGPRLIDMAQRQGVAGELEGDTLGIPDKELADLILGLGLDITTMNLPKIAGIRLPKALSAASDTMGPLVQKAGEKVYKSAVAPLDAALSKWKRFRDDISATPLGDLLWEGMTIHGGKRKSFNMKDLNRFVQDEMAERGKRIASKRDELEAAGARIDREKATKGLQESADRLAGIEAYDDVGEALQKRAKKFTHEKVVKEGQEAVPSGLLDEFGQPLPDSIPMREAEVSWKKKEPLTITEAQEQMTGLNRHIGGSQLNPGNIFKNTAAYDEEKVALGRWAKDLREGIIDTFDETGVAGKQEYTDNLSVYSLLKSLDEDIRKVGVKELNAPGATQIDAGLAASSIYDPRAAAFLAGKGAQRFLRAPKVRTSIGIGLDKLGKFSKDISAWDSLLRQALIQAGGE